MMYLQSFGHVIIKKNIEAGISFLNFLSDVHGSKSGGSGGARNKQGRGGGGFGYQRSKHQFKSKVFKQVSGNKKSGSKRQFSRWPDEIIFLEDGQNSSINFQCWYIGGV